MNNAPKVPIHQKPPKVTHVYGSTADGVRDILDSAIADEPPPTASAQQLVEDAEHAGPILPEGATGVPGGGGGVPGADPAAALPAAATPLESAASLVELMAALPPDWRPDDDDERAELTHALERVFAVRNFTPRLPPELLLFAVVMKYTRKRLARPHVAAKVVPWLAGVPLVGRFFRPKLPDPAPTNPAEQPAAASPAAPFNFPPHPREREKPDHDLSAFLDARE